MKVPWNNIRAITDIIDSLTETIGKTISWLNLVLVLAVCLVVVFRYLLNLGSIAMQESAVYLHAIIFLGASGYALKHDEHVRVDIFYRNMSPRNKALVNSFGTLFLLIPVCLFIGIMSWEYIANSWAIFETSNEPGGLPFVYLLKTFLLFLVVSLLLQGVAELLRSLMIINGTLHEDHQEELNHG